MRLLTIVLGLASLCLADTITFRDGHTVNGSYLGGDARTVRMAVGDHVESYSVSDITNIVFSGETRVTSRAPEPRRDQAPPEEPRPMRRDRANGPVLPVGTVLTIRMIDSVDSQRDTVGQTFRASLDEPVMDSNGDTLVPRGSDVMVKLVERPAVRQDRRPDGSDARSGLARREWTDGRDRYPESYATERFAHRAQR